MAIIDLTKFKNKKVLVIFPHPDDETVMAGGLIQQLLAVGAKVSLVCLTSGDQGKIHIHGRGQSLGQIRRGEFFLAVRRLGVSNFEIFNFPDGKLRNIHTWHPVVGDYVSHYDLVVGYDASGVTGHPDHIALGRFLEQSCRRSGISLWRASPLGLIRQATLDRRVAGYLQPASLEIQLSLRGRLVKWWAFAAYQSQYPFLSIFLALLAAFAPHTEGFSVFRRTTHYPSQYVDFEF